MLETGKLQSPSDERFWYAMYTRPRFEKKVDCELKRKRLHSFLPLQQQTRVWSDRLKTIEAPLFPSYIFVHANRRERYDALQTTGVIRVVGFNGQAVRIPEAEIDAIRVILEHGYCPEPYQYLRFGDEVEIVTGALKGLRGFYREQRGQDRMAISIHAIQQSVAVHVDRDAVRKVAGAHTVAA